MDHFYIVVMIIVMEPKTIIVFEVVEVIIIITFEVLEIIVVVIVVIEMAEEVNG
jgi:hypothetical protein